MDLFRQFGVDPVNRLLESREGSRTKIIVRLDANVVSSNLNAERRSLMTLTPFRFLCLVGMLTFSLAPAIATAGQPPTHIGDRLELFVDQHLIASMKGVRLEMHAPQPREVALTTDKPWEDSDSAYVTVFRDDDRFRMYYRGTGNAGKQEVACYAESKDGIRWTKPSLGLFEFNGSKENNIVWMGEPPHVTHNFTVFKDTRPGVPADQKYKAIGGLPLFVFASADGLRFRLLSEKPVITKGAFDSQNLAFWDPNKKKYAAYFRIGHEGRRFIATCTSDDYLNWSEPTPIDVGKTPREHFYTNATQPYFRAPHYYFAFPKRFNPSRRRSSKYPNNGISEGIFLSSRDGLHFDRTFLQTLIRPGRDPKNWGDRSNMPAWGLVQTAPDEMSIYYSQNYRFPTHHLRRGVFRLDGIASASAGYEAGELITKPILFSGGKLVLNYATSASGSVRVELQDASGKPLEGFELANSRELYGDEIAETYSWKSGEDVSTLAGKPVQLRFVLKDADLYSYRFAEPVRKPDDHGEP